MTKKKTVAEERDHWLLLAKELNTQVRELKKQNSEYIEALREVQRYFNKRANKGKWSKRLTETLNKVLNDKTT